MLSNDALPLGDMDQSEFRQAGYQLVDWISKYLSQGEMYPVLSRSQPGEIKAQIPSVPPESGESMAAILSDFEDILLPGITHWNQPGFLAYFSSTGSAPGILGEFLTAGLNVNGMLWRTAPAATELEEVTLDWLRQMLTLPEDFYGIITDTASMSNLLAIVAAREALDLNIREKGLSGRNELKRLRMYISDQTHSSVEKGAITAGIGQEGVRKIRSDAAFRMNVESLTQAIEEDIDNGWLPFCVVATVGTTATTSIDPLPEIANACQEKGLWLHVDAAYGGTAAILPEFRHILNGVEYADSFVVNPHKWLFTPLDCSAFYVRRPDNLRQAFSLVPSYLTTAESGVTNYMDWGIQLGRRFRALKLWMILQYFGRQGLQDRVREHIRLGQLLADWVDADPDFERLAPAPLSTVCFRFYPRDLRNHQQKREGEDDFSLDTYIDHLNEALVESMNATGEVFLSATRLRDRYTIRIAIGNIRTQEAHIQRAWQLLGAEARRLDKTLRLHNGI